MNIKELAEAATRVQENIDERSRQRGNEVGKRVVEQTRLGRGLWFVLHWPIWLVTFIVTGSICVNILTLFGMGAPLKWVGLLGGFICARAWYRAEFTRKRPFWSAVLWWLSIALLGATFSSKTGMPLLV